MLQWRAPRKWTPSATVLLMLAALGLVSCGASSAGKVTVTATLPTAMQVTTVGPTATSGPVAICPSSLTTPALATALGLTAGATIAQVDCVSLRGNGQIDAVIQIQASATPVASGGAIDIDVVALPLSSPVTPLLALRGLASVTVVVSQARTLLISSTDALSCVATSSSTASGPRVVREYAWNGTAYVLSLFPGIYPWTNRMDAEAAQRQLDQSGGVAQDPVSVASAFATQQLGWVAATTAIRLTTIAPTSAQVTLSSPFAPGGLIISLARLGRTDTTGIWEVVGVSTESGFTVTAPASGTTIAPPIVVTGTATASSQIAVRIYDHAGCQIATTTNLTTNAAGTFSGTLNYQADPGVSGPQPCVLWIGTTDPFTGAWQNAWITPALC